MTAIGNPPKSIRCTPLPPFPNEPWTIKDDIKCLFVIFLIIVFFVWLVLRV